MRGSRVAFDPDTFSIIRDCHKLTFSILTAVYNSYGAERSFSYRVGRLRLAQRIMVCTAESKD